MAEEEIVSPAVDPPAGPSRNPQGKYISSRQRQMAYNLYLQLKHGKSKMTAVKLTSKHLGLSESTMWEILKQMDTTGILSSPPKKRLRQTTYDELDEAQKSTIRRHVIIEDDTLPELKRTTLWKILKKLGFKWEKRSRNNVLTERQDIVLWRRRYLTNIRKFRAEGRKIYYLDETWVNAGHTKQNVWKDTTVLTTRQALLEGVTMGLRNPSGKGNRLIVLHVGSEDGFVENGLLFFESKKNGDYHEDMNSEVFTEWMRYVLPFLEPNCVIVMDNAPYHSVKTEKSPTAAWKKDALIEWLLSKGIVVDSTLLKVELLAIAKTYIDNNSIPYVIDQMAAESGRTVLRLPPYHCSLNPIELIWAQVKHHVAANNKTFKLAEVKTLLQEGLNLISTEAWVNCIKHTILEENKMYELDNIVEEMVEELIINVNTGSSTDLSSESDFE